MAGAINLLEEAFEKQTTSERRFGERRSAPSLAVYYWNGGTPTPHRIRDISLSGVYLVTREELFPGAMILLTMQRDDLDETTPDRWIAVHALVVRRDADGVALSFVFPRSRQSRIWKVDLANGATRLEVAIFLTKLFEDEGRQIEQTASVREGDAEISESACREPACSQRLRSVGTAKVCVCNLSQERLLSLNMSVIDTVPTPMKTLVDDLSDISESGLWLTPFRGIPCGSGLSRFDVLFLDDNHRVAECVERFAVAESGSFLGKHATAIVVPSGTVACSQVRVGDQLRICSPDSRANNLSNPLWSSANSAREWEEVVEKQFHCVRKAPSLKPQTPSGQARKAAHLSNQDGHAASFDWKQASLKTRLLRRIFPSIKPPDRRRAERIPVQEFMAHYFNGTLSKPDRVGDVSANGFFLITEERWLPGTRIVITLQKETAGDDCTLWSKVESKVVRWGEDGVGFEFVDAKDVRILEANQFDKRAFDHFLAEMTAASS